MTKRRLVIAVSLVLLAIGLGVWRWRSGGEATSPSEGPTAATGRPAMTPAAGDAPHWVGQAGVGGRKIAGTVVDDSGSPIAGASVRLSSIATIAGLRTEPVVVTDARGRFDFGGRAAAEYVVVAEAPHRTGALDKVDLRDPLLVPAPDQLRLLLHACDASIHGTIRDTAGGVIAGVRIARDQITGASGVESDRDGAYELCVPAGGSQVMVSGDGYAVLRDTINVFGRTRRDFELAPGASVGGRVVRAGDKAPVAGAIVELQPENWQGGGTQLFAASDAEGKFHIDGVTPGRHQMTARADRLVTAAPLDVIAEVGQPSDDNVCELAAAFTVTGRVVAKGGSAPIPGATVVLTGATSRGARPASAITQRDGSFTIDRVLPGEYSPLVVPYMRRLSRGAERPKPVKVEASDVTGVVVAIDPGASISGRILRGGKPVDGAAVMIQSGGGRAESNQDGTYTLRALEAGTHEVYAESHRVGAFGRSPAVTIASGEERTGVDVELALSGSISGIVVDDSDAPVAGVFLSFSLLHGKDFGSATTADDGTFTARSLSGGGDYVFEVRQRDRSPLVFPPATGKRHPPVTVADGGTHVTGVRVKIHVERLAISGRVTDAANKPVADVTVRATPADSARNWGSVSTAVSTENGAFTIRDLPGGTYTLQASGARGDGRLDGVTAGQTNAMLRLAETGGIDGTLDGITATWISAMRDDARTAPAQARISGTRFTFSNLEAGTYRVIASTPNGTESVQVTVTSGAIATVTLRAHESGSVEGTAVDAKTREPIAGLRCASRIASDDFAPPGSMSTTDARGAFRIERAPVGANQVMCGGTGGFGSTTATVTAGQAVRVQIAISAGPRQDERKAQAGMKLEEQLGDVMVESVTPDGPAARAGVQRGDVLVKINDVDVKRLGHYGAVSAIEDAPIDEPLKLVLERNDKQLSVSLTLVPAP